MEHLVLENLIKDSHKSTELLHEIYFDCVNGEISDAKILETLEEVSKNLTVMQSEIKHQLVTVKKHRKS